MSETPPNIFEPSNIDNNFSLNEISDKKQSNEVHYLLDTNIIISIFYELCKIEKLKLDSTDVKLIIHIPTIVLTELLDQLRKKDYKSKKELKELIGKTLIKFDSTILEGREINNSSDDDMNDVIHNIDSERLESSLKLSLCKIFEKIGTVVFDDSDEKSKMDWAKKFETEKRDIWEYRNAWYEPLSKEDCRLLKFYLDEPSWHLFTNDASLRTAVEDEGDLMGKPRQFLREWF